MKQIDKIILKIKGEIVYTEGCWPDVYKMKGQVRAKKQGRRLIISVR